MTNAAPTSDSTPPQVLSFSLAPQEVNTESADQTVTVTMRITDDQAGVAVEGDYGSTSNPVNLSLKPLIGTQYVWFRLQRTSGTDRDGIYTGTTTIPRGSKEGVWQVAWLRLGDKIGNFVDLDAASLNAVLPGTDLLVANTAQAQQVTIDRDWTISSDRASVTFSAGTIVTRADDGRFAFYLMTAQDFVLDETIPQTDLDGVPIATLRFGIPGLNLTFSQPVGSRWPSGRSTTATA